MFWQKNTMIRSISSTLHSSPGNPYLVDSSSSMTSGIDSAVFYVSDTQCPRCEYKLGKNIHVVSNIEDIFLTPHIRNLILMYYFVYGPFLTMITASRWGKPTHKIPIYQCIMLLLQDIN